MKLRRDVTALQIAELHRDLAEAWCAVRKVSRATLTKHNAYAIHRMEERLLAMLLALEAPFAQKAGSNAPFANCNAPKEWLEWLAARGAR